MSCSSPRSCSTGTAEGTFQVDHPSLVGRVAAARQRRSWVAQEASGSPLEVELAIVESLFESVDELAAKNFTQHFLGKKVVVCERTQQV